MVLFGMILWVSSNLLHAQISDFEAKILFERSIYIQKTGMIVLGSWATLNILSGIPGTLQNHGNRKYFHQMNAAWNTVNLTIATFSFLAALSTDPSITSDQIFVEMKQFDRILLINAGLDLAYIGTGIYLWKRGFSTHSDRLIGYGKSVVLQGGFLLLFDGLLYLIHHQETKKLMLFGTELSLNSNGFTLAF
ncbi:MAG: DUF6992 family protein [Balneola sp.]